VKAGRAAVEERQVGNWILRQAYAHCDKPGGHCSGSAGHGPSWAGYRRQGSKVLRATSSRCSPLAQDLAVDDTHWPNPFS
jgi:hypothetical protein